MEVSLQGVKIMLGMPLKDSMPKQTAFSLAQTMFVAGQLGVDARFAIGSASNNDRARDLVVDGFLQSDCDKLFWLDSDMVWSPQEFFQLVALSTFYDIVLASYPAKTEGPSPFFVDFDMPSVTNEHGLLKIKGAGLGFCCMDRKAVQAIADMHPMIYDQSIGRIRKKIFRHDIGFEHTVEVDGVDYPTDRTEDFAFFADAMECGFDIWLHPGIELGHIGQKEWRAKFADATNIVKMNEQDTQ